MKGKKVGYEWGKKSEEQNGEEAKVRGGSVRGSEGRPGEMMELERRRREVRGSEGRRGRGGKGMEEKKREEGG